MGALQDFSSLWRLCILWLHLCGVVVWMGGLSCALLVLGQGVPRRASVPQRLHLILSLEARLRTVMWPAVGMVLFTGLVNVMSVFSATVLMGEGLPPGFVPVLSVKLSLVFGMLCIHAVQQFIVQPQCIAWLGRLESAVQEFPPGLARLQRLAWMLRVAAFVLGMVVLFVALFLRGL